MEIAEHIAIVQREGELLALAAQRTSLDAPVPTCPDWTLRDLVRHVGGVHRWAATIVSESRGRPHDPFAELEAFWPSDAGLVDWFRAATPMSICKTHSRARPDAHTSDARSASPSKVS